MPISLHSAGNKHPCKTPSVSLSCRVLWAEEGKPWTAESPLLGLQVSFPYDSFITKQPFCRGVQDLITRCGGGTTRGLSKETTQSWSRQAGVEYRTTEASDSACV